MNSGEELSQIILVKCEEEQVEKPKKLTLKERKAIRRARLLVGKNTGRWSFDQRRQYYIFLKIYSQFFVSKDHRRNDKVYRMMANFIKSRTPDQCRTHHQKLEAKFHRCSKILQALKEQFGMIQFEEIVRKCDNTTTAAGTPTEEINNEQFFSQKNNDKFQYFGNGVKLDVEMNQIFLDLPEKQEPFNLVEDLVFQMSQRDNYLQ